jgi:hypothetical protein
MRKTLINNENPSYIVVYTLLSILMLFTLAGCDTTKPSVEPTDSFITMTTTTHYVSFTLQALGEVSIDWGDSEGWTVIYAIGDGYTHYSHEYLNREVRTITIYGDITHLNCSGIGLTDLNVKNNRYLLFLNCHNNLLTSLDISGNKYLEELLVSHNQLDYIDISNNNKLRILNSRSNNLTRLDASSNVELQVLSSSRNMITYLDISKSPNLEFLSAYENQLSEIDVCHNPALRHIDICDNKITSIDISHNTLLWWLYAQNNSLTSVVLGNNLSLMHVALHSNQLESDALNDIFHNLPDHSTNTTFGSYVLNIRENPGTNDCDIGIAQKKGWAVAR